MSGIGWWFIIVFIFLSVLILVLGHKVGDGKKGKTWVTKEIEAGICKQLYQILEGISGYIKNNPQGEENIYEWRNKFTRCLSKVIKDIENFRRRECGYLGSGIAIDFEKLLEVVDLSQAKISKEELMGIIEMDISASANHESRLEARMFIRILSSIYPRLVNS